MRALYRAIALVSALLVAGPVLAQGAYPSRPVKVIVPVTAGGAPDIAARLIGDQLGELLGQPFVVENRAGSNGNIGMDLVAKAAPDGHTLALGADSFLVINPHVYTRMPFDPMKDLVAVASIATNQFVISVNPKVPARTLAEFVAVAKSANPPLSYASGGNGSQHQLAMEDLKGRAGINLLHVPYKGATPAATATIAGETSVLFSGSASAPHFRSGALRPLAVSGAKRSPMFPDLPRVADTFPGFDVTIWLGLFAPAATPAPIVERLHKAVREIMERPGFGEKLNVSGSLEPLILTREAFQQRIREDFERYGTIVRKVGVKLD